MHLSVFKNTTQAWVDSAYEDTWDNIADTLLVHCGASSKDQVPLYNLVQFKQASDSSVEYGRKYDYVDGVRSENYVEVPNTVRRCRNNVLGYSGIVLDVDRIMTMEDAVVAYEGLEYVLYTTFSHTPEHHKFRVVIPFTRTLPIHELAGRLESIQETFPGVDRASFSVSQSFYFHSGGVCPFAIRVRGQMIDPYAFEYREPPIYMPRQYHSDYVVSDLYRDAVRRSLLTMRDVRYTDGLTLVACCRSVGLSFSDFEQICDITAAKDSALVKQRSCRRGLWNTAYDRITAASRDKFIQRKGGKNIIDIRYEQLQQRKEKLLWE